ncbi:hypothetical protein RRG08_011124 [Elysia crispata]|uniref:Uncharacterized protein n=1 Tax=Elysia crispata TaxID=231223 RepID=A0AAE1DQG8_9GAST|nr:hypothetical protein RRG08_011124 [Elysia crispata]
MACSVRTLVTDLPVCRACSFSKAADFKCMYPEGEGKGSGGYTASAPRKLNPPSSIGRPFTAGCAPDEVTFNWL